LSLFTLGSAQWGQSYGISNTTGKPEKSEIERMLSFAALSNISTIDTARTYGLSEKLIGEILKARPDNKFRVITKLSPDVYEQGLSEKDTVVKVKISIRESIRALQVEKLDTLLLHHGFHRSVISGIIWETLKGLQNSGEISKIGISAKNPEEALEALCDPSVEVLQVASSLLDQRLVRNGFFDKALKQNREVFVRSVYLQGVAFLDPNRLSGHLKPLAPILNSIQIFSQDLHVKPEEIWLHFARSISAKNLILGTESLDQLMSNFEIMNKPISAAVEEFSSKIPQFDDALLDPSLWKL
jgi:aryl-alcohol dehydrogenase-like predicted oxidoreductase